MQRLCVGLWAAILCCLGSAAALAAAPAGSVIDVVGEVSVVRNAARLKAGLFDNLFVGDVIQLPQGARLVLTHNATKREYALTAPGEFEVAAEEIRARGGARPQARELAELAVLSLAPDGARGRATVGAIRMRGAAPPPTFPLEGETILTLTPELSWPAQPGYASYQLLLKQADGKVLLERTVDRAEYRIEAQGLLAWGGRYQWLVAAEQEGRRLSIAKSFKVVADGERDSLERLHPGAAGEFSAWVVYARALEHLGAISAARAVWARLAAQRPDLTVLEGLAKGK